MPKECGDCAWCCYFPEQPALQKPGREWCTHCPNHNGCAIYDERPKGCRDFECVWLHYGDELGDNLRPDRCGVMFEQISQDTIIAWVLPGCKNAWMTPPVKDIVFSMVRDDVAVVVKDGPNTHVLLPERRTEEDVRHDLRQAHYRMNTWLHQATQPTSL